MLHGELYKQVSRLRELTGQKNSNVQHALEVKTVDDGTLQLLQQSIRRHPCIYHFSCTDAEAENLFFEKIKAAFSSSATLTGAGKVLEWINKLSEDLEVERLTSVVTDPHRTIERYSEEFLHKLGFHGKPKYSQNDFSYSSPWNVWLLLLSGPLVQRHFVEDEKGPLEIANSTSKTRRFTVLLESDILNVDAWTGLLNEIDGFPLAAVRSIWLLALYYFPSCGTLCLWYLRKEISELSHSPSLSQCLSEDDAKKAFKSCSRILGTFYRHLPLCLDCRLYELFFAFLQQHVEPDQVSLLELYRVTLQRDVGEHLSSTPIWHGYIALKCTSIANSHDRREWKKKILLRMLQTPLKDLDEVKKSYDYFIVSEYRGRLSPEEKGEVEKSYNRSRAAAQELSKMMQIVRSLTEGSLFLPRPINLDSKLEGSQSEMELWVGWQGVLEYVKRRFVLHESLLDFERYLRFLFMRASFFPFQIDSWSDIAECCKVIQFPGMESHRGASILNRVEKLSLLFMYNELGIQLLQVDLVKKFNHDASQCAMLLKEALLFHRKQLRFEIKIGCPDIDTSIEHLQAICVLGVAWMNLPRKQNTRYHVRLVARHIIHSVHFLTLSIALTREMIKSDRLTEIRRIFQPFHTFCFQWIELELIKNKAVDEALIILMQWKEQIALLLKSLTKRICITAEFFGADELFLKSCGTIVQAAPEKFDEVVLVASDLKNIIQSNNIKNEVFLNLFDDMMYEHFSALNLKTVSAPFQAPGRARLRCQFSAPQRVESFFLIPDSEFLHPLSHVYLNENSKQIHKTDDFAFPEEGLWNTPAAVSNGLKYQKRRARDEDSTSSKKFRPENQNFLPVLNKATDLLSLDTLLEAGANAPSLPLNQLQKIIQRMPNEYQYCSNTLLNKKISATWLQSTLEKCHGL